MKKVEIQKETSDCKYYDYIDRVASEKGLKQISFGVYSRVFAPKRKPKTSKTVIKICNDPGYFKYITMVMRARKSNPWLPRIKSVKVLKFTPPPIDMGPNKSPLQNQEEEFYEIELERLRHNVTKAEMLGSSMSYSKKTWGKTFNLSQMKGFRTNPKQIRRVNKILKRLCDNGHTQDLHGMNIMFRGRQPVITDPVC